MSGNVHYFSVLDMDCGCLSGNAHYFSVLGMDCMRLVTCIISVCCTWTVGVW